MTKKRRTFLKTIGASGVAIAVAGCANDDDDPADDPADESPEEEGEIEDPEEEDEEDVAEGEEANLRVAHLSPDAPSVDVSLDGEVVIEELAFGEFSEFSEIETGTSELEIAEAEDEENVVFDEELEIGEGSFTAVALGELAEENHPFSVGVLEDDPTDPGDEARVRLLHASPDAPSVDITTEDGTELFEDIAFGEFDTATVEEGEYTLEVRPAADPDEEEPAEEEEPEDEEEPAEEEDHDDEEEENLSYTQDEEDEEDDEEEEDEEDDEEEEDEEEEDEDVVATFDVNLMAGTIYTAAAAGYLEPDDAPGNAEFDLIVVEDDPEELDDEDEDHEDEEDDDLEEDDEEVDDDEEDDDLEEDDEEVDDDEEDDDLEEDDEEADDDEEEEEHDEDEEEDEEEET